VRIRKKVYKVYYGAMEYIQKVIAVAVVRNTKGEILVQKRIDDAVPAANGKWEFPGGMVEFGETPEQAATREVVEETNCIIEITRILPLAYTYVWEKADGGSMQAFVWFFEAQYVSGKPTPLDKKVAEVQWVTKEQLLQLDCLPGVGVSLHYVD
jgi:8-oxo-dGTP diphosphatase